MAKIKQAAPATNEKSLDLLVQRWEALQIRGKKAYSEAGQLLSQIAARMQAGETCTLADGRTPSLIDKADPNFWKGRAYMRDEIYLKRYELSIQ